MFYPVESLKRGGRFYLCWVADSWPLRFATITHRQLWSQDIRKICDDLIEVMTNESGRPANRFSLRLSSQLMRGLVRLYQRKVTVFLGDLCMINANVTKNVNKKWNIADVVVNITHHRLPHLPAANLEVQEEPEVEQRIEEIIQNSGNIVGNIQDITLKETVIPEILLPPNDGFGEENTEQALNLLQNQTIEMMLAGDRSAQLSALGAALDHQDKSHDRSRVPADAQMEPITQLDATIFAKSCGDERLTMGGFEKDVPEIPDILLPELPVPPPPEIQVVEEPQVQEPPPAAEPTKQPEEPAVEIELEELEQGPPSKRRRLKNKLIIDKKIKLTADYLVARIENTHVELRCEDGADDIADTRLPVDILFRRPARAGPRPICNISNELVRLYQRNLGVGARPPVDDREMEEMAAERTSRVRTRSVLERIEEEEPTAVPVTVQVQVHVEPPMPEAELFKDPNVFEPQNVTVPVEQVDISDLPTQKILVTESQSRKRTSEYDLSPKRQRLSGYVSFRQSQQLAIETSVPIIEAEKENMPGAANIIQTEQLVEIPMCDEYVRPSKNENVRRSNDENVRPSNDDNVRPSNGENVRPSNGENVHPSNAEKSLTMMLEEAGLADLPMKAVDEQETAPHIVATQRAGRRGGSESSETPLGSLDRTKVSLGDSEQTTDSKRFIRDQWGTEGTMVKILRHIKVGLKPLTVKKLISKGPVMAGYKSIMAARCFTSILKLKQHGFIIINKDLETLEIKDILLGPKFDHIK